MIISLHPNLTIRLKVLLFLSSVTAQIQINPRKYKLFYYHVRHAAELLTSNWTMINYENYGFIHSFSHQRLKKRLEEQLQAEQLHELINSLS